MPVDARHTTITPIGFGCKKPGETPPAEPSAVRVVWRGLLLVGLLVGAVACEGPTPENQQYGDPLVWPQASRLGDSVAWLISSDVLPNFQQAPTPFFTWTADNVEIGLIDELGYAAPPQAPRLVFEAQSAVGAKLRGTSHQANVGAIVAVFDLPSAWPNAANPVPLRLDLVLYVQGQEIGSWTNSIEILGDGGSPTVFGIATAIAPLEHGPMLRLRPRWESATNLGIDPSWLIGGIEFTLAYPELAEGSLTAPRAIPAGDAATALSLTGPVQLDESTNRVRINVLLPGGFQLFHEGCDPSGCYSGRTSLVDIAFTTDSGSIPLGMPIFGPSDFEIESLKIVNPVGVQLNTTNVATDYFDLFVVSNLAEGP
jgi:hypothetical protein